MTTDLKAVPLQETTPVAESAPRRRGRPPGSRTGTRERAPRRTRSYVQPVASMLMLFNMGFNFLPYPWRRDQLDEAEITALARAIDAQAKASKTFAKYLDGALAVGGGSTQLILVAGMIGARRVARHGLIGMGPNEDAMLGAMIAGGMQIPEAQDESPATPDGPPTTV